jgi:hypothetical protein
MSVSTLPRSPVENWEAERDEWVAAVERLIDEAEAWAREQPWFVHRDRKTITEDTIGSYEVSVLMIRTSQAGLILDPIARYIMGASGLIDFCVFPSYEYVRVLRTEVGWQFATNPPTINRPWSKEAFLEITSELAKKA